MAATVEMSVIESDKKYQEYQARQAKYESEFTVARLCWIAEYCNYDSKYYVEMKRLKELMGSLNSEAFYYLKSKGWVTE